MLLEDVVTLLLGNPPGAGVGELPAAGVASLEVLFQDERIIARHFGPGSEPGRTGGGEQAERQGGEGRKMPDCCGTTRCGHGSPPKSRESTVKSLWDSERNLC